ncbi:hypothetical protein GQ457_05G015410 [Hibiscus cannabinus]
MVSKEGHVKKELNFIIEEPLKVVSEELADKKDTGVYEIGLGPISEHVGKNEDKKWGYVVVDNVDKGQVSKKSWADILNESMNTAKGFTSSDCGEAFSEGENERDVYEDLESRKVQYPFPALLRTKMANFTLVFSILCLSYIKLICFLQANAQPTSGFTAVSLSQSNFELQKPYDLSPSDRYSFNNGVHRFWVYSTDKPHTPSSDTRPRSEIRIRGYDYSSGVWQFEGEAYIPSGTTETSIMQVFGGSSRANAPSLRRLHHRLQVAGGALKRV